jgi:predicted transcriptional regulator
VSLQPAPWIANSAARRICRTLLAEELSHTLNTMEVHFTPEQEAQLDQIASDAGTDAEKLVKDAALRLLQEDARFRAAVREGIAQADRGEFIEEEEMNARIEQMLRS